MLCLVNHSMISNLVDDVVGDRVSSQTTECMFIYM